MCNLEGFAEVYILQLYAAIMVLFDLVHSYHKFSLSERN